MQVTINYGETAPLKFTIPKKWSSKTLDAVVDFFVDYHNKKHSASVAAADLCVYIDGRAVEQSGTVCAGYRSPHD